MNTKEGKGIVAIKLGGNVLASRQAVLQLASQLKELDSMGFSIVLLHGGGVLIDQEMKRRGIDAKKVNGMRVTCATTMAIVDSVLNRANTMLADQLHSAGVNVSGCNSQCRILQGRKIHPALIDGCTVDLGYVGTVTGVAAAKLEELLAAGTVPLITPLAVDAGGHGLNINADEAAAAIAAALKADRLLLLTDVPGILSPAGPEQKVQTIQTLTRSQWQSMVANGSISGGMLPKIYQAFEAIRNGVQAVHIIDGTEPDSIIKAIAQPGTTGTTIAA